MITTIFGCRERVITVSSEELIIARNNFPSLLSQANGYGSDFNGQTGSCTIGPMPKRLADNFAVALEKAREVKRG